MGLPAAGRAHARNEISGRNALFGTMTLSELFNSKYLGRFNKSETRRRQPGVTPRRVGVQRPRKLSLIKIWRS